MCASVHTFLNSSLTICGEAENLSVRPKDKKWQLKNKLLMTMPEAVCARLQPELRIIELEAGRTIYETNAQQHCMVFPRDGLISLLYVLENGDTSEIAMVGNEGMVGVALLVDSHSTPSRGVVQIEGEALALSTEAVNREFKLGGAFQFGILRFTQSLLTQMAQCAVCGRHHSIEKQLCRWLLLASDRVGGEAIRMTQDGIARLLGVRREGIAAAAKNLQTANIIDYGRGVITILDHPALRARACECYGVINHEYERLLSPLPSPR